LRHKLIYYYADPLDQEGAVGPTEEPEWELFDLTHDPYELVNVYDDPSYKDVIKTLKADLSHLQDTLGDAPYEP
jgi:hypothetical protein